MKPIEINKEDVNLWFEEQAYDGRSEECLHNYIAVLRHAQQKYQMGEESFSGLTLLNDSFNNNVISYNMFMTLIPLIALPGLEYTIVHKKDEK